MSDPTLFNASVPTEGTGANTYEWLLDFNLGAPGSFVNAPDIDNFNPVFPPLTKGRTSYATKGKTLNNKFGEGCTITVDVEKVRIPATGGIAQPWLKALIAAAHGKDEANRIPLRFYDAIDTTPDAEAYEGLFSVDSMTRKDTSGTSTTGEWYTFTLTVYGDVERITTPVEA